MASPLQQAIQLHQSGRLAEAERLYRAALRAKPREFDALHLLGLLRHQQGQLDEALRLINKALAVNSRSVAALCNQGIVLHDMGRYEEALASYRRALEMAPNDPAALTNLGNTLRTLRRYDDALAAYDRILAENDQDVEAHYNRGIVFLQVGRHTDALECCDRVLAVEPEDADAHNNRAIALKELGRLEEAAEACNRALTLRADFPEALINRGNVLRALDRYTAALSSYDQALSLAPSNVDAWNGRGNVLADLKQLDEAISAYDRAIALAPDHAEAHVNRGGVLSELKRHAEAIESFERGLALAPDHPHALSGLATSALAICDWTRTAALSKMLAGHVLTRKSCINPQTFLGYSDDPALQLACARNYIAMRLPAAPGRPHLPTYRHDKIRLAYVSADFRQHATSYLAAELFELHDRSRFEVMGFSIGLNDASDMRVRLVKAFDAFHDVHTKNDGEIAGLLRELEIDIAVDLTAHLHNSRPGIFAHRSAPVQVSYLVYPGTLGADFMDYIIGDKIVLPFAEEPFYCERIVHLPDCYQPNDSKRAISAQTPLRADMGLPADAFVFCCFNNPYKITEPVFDVWMSVLQAVDGSVLWLLRDDVRTEDNLRREAANRGVDPDRLVFAERLDSARHLARHRLADLFLDTLPYNAHTTASDALWAGLPVLTCRGKSFPGRVAASLLNAMGLDDLVTDTLADYERLAIELARNAAHFRELRERTARNRLTSPLFDAARYCRHIEAAYKQMMQIHRKGEAPRNFSVTPLE